MTRPVPSSARPEAIPWTIAAVNTDSGADRSGPPSSATCTAVVAVSTQMPSPEK
ncbi:hypothetical protein [Nocardia albiluteola]|uniref:hypothetical protein n=1 Tax=Nocardia albiluteola TaxID=2842303 RepID=UPI001FDA2BEF|nr:hypothetical protein [Nocardia albiluteola]